MKEKFSIFVILFGLLVAVGCDRSQPDKTVEEQGAEKITDGYIKSGDWPDEPQRILSIAPNITEILFELGLGDRVVAVSRYCDWPEEVEGLPRVGGVLDPDYEAILATEADVVLGVTHDSDRALMDRLANADLAYGFMAIEDFSSIFEAIEQIGGWFDVEDLAQELTDQMEADLQAGAERISQLLDGQALSVLLVFDREPVVAAGPDSFGDELIARAGLENALSGEGLGNYPVLDMEHILQTNPEVIVDVTYGPNAADEARRYWSRFDAIDAVVEGRIIHIDDPVMLRPGPRIPQAVERLGQVLEAL
jgi:iron complex transport system substrate-binding protein